MNIDASTQSFSELISDLQCRDIPVKDQIIIGEKIWSFTGISRHCRSLISSLKLCVLISDLQCRDIPVKDQIIIGEKIGNVRVDIESDPVVKALPSLIEGE